MANHSVNSMDTLAEVTRRMSASLSLAEAFPDAMAVLGAHLDVKRAALYLRDERSEQLVIQASWNMTTEQIHRGRFSLGEGVVGSVVANGHSRIIPDVTREPDFLNRTGGRVLDGAPLSYICHPLVLSGHVIGALAIDLPHVSERQLADDARLLRIAADMIAQQIQIHRLVAQEKRTLLEENEQLRQSLGSRYRFDNLVGRSSAMEQIFETVAQVAVTRATVLITGETGTGKELIAKAIHYNSPRRSAPFIRVNCGALAETLLESELFGHVEGAFTGATRDRIGRFEAANGGTILLDEIQSLEPRLQVKLLRVLQERELERVGATTPVKLDVRIIASSNLSLEDRVAEGDFREDLYYRLNVVHISLPPLRQRREDIPRLIDHFLDRYNQENSVSVTQISPAVLDLLLRYPWPGNVRELENAIERAVVMSRGQELTENLLPLAVRNWAARNESSIRSLPSQWPSDVASLADRLVRQVQHDPGGVQGELWERAISATERALIQCGLEATDGVKLAAADYLGINRNTLNAKIRKLGAE
ncbi:MAG: Anaerobic nitric oxide reductase transcription regulator NorR [Phycisphaerae bacterium]|nr:Anaerobic nitric oxide reductase transcription regulator NorR [Phycisphaerae bacterium]